MRRINVRNVSKYFTYLLVVIFTLFLFSKSISISFTEPDIEFLFTLFKFTIVFIFVLIFFISIIFNQRVSSLSISNLFFEVSSKVMALFIIIFSVKIFIASNESNFSTMLSGEEDSFTAIFTITSMTLISIYLLFDIDRFINKLFIKTHYLSEPEGLGRAVCSSFYLSEKDIDIASAHEAGHLMAVHSLSDLLNTVSVSIGSVGISLGRVQYSYLKPRKLYQKDVIEREMLISIAGSVAEEMVFNTTTTGSVSDMRIWESYARDYLINYSEEYFYVTPSIDKEVEHNNYLLNQLKEKHKDIVLNYLKSNINIYNEIYSEIKEKHSIEHERVMTYFKRIDNPLV